MKDYLQKAYCYNDTMRIYAAITTETVETARVTHNMWPTSCAALGRVLTIAEIMSCTYKSNERLTFRINGGGPIGQITCEACNGYVRGFVQNAGVYVKRNDGHLAVGYAVGTDGFITVTKDLNMREPFTSTSALVSGEIAQDFTYYFAMSEQIPSAVGLGVLIDVDNTVKSAGGFLIQVMPGCKDEYITDLENRLKTAKPASQMVEEGYTAEQMINELTGGNYHILETREIGYKCDCSKEKFFTGIKSVGKDEVKKILTEDGKAEVTCQFCGKKYEYSKEDLEQMLKELED